MLLASEGIVLHTLKYRETSVIATLYTREFGRQSYLINGVRGRKSKQKAGLLQPLFLVDILAYQKQTRDLHRMKEFKSQYAYQNIAFDPLKSAQAIFLAEMLYKTIHEQESFPEMYDFIKNALLIFDLTTEGTANFHLYFLYRLTEYLGFFPDIQAGQGDTWFDLKSGKLVPFQPLHPYYAGKHLSRALVQLAATKINDIGQLEIGRQIRDELLGVFIDYYHLHFDNLGEIKSLKVLREVFAD